MVLWSEETLRKIAREEAKKFLTESTARADIKSLAIDALSSSEAISALSSTVRSLLRNENLAILGDLAREEMEKTKKVLMFSFSKMIENQKEEVKILLSAQKSFITKEINKHIGFTDERANSALASFRTKSEIEIKTVEKKLHEVFLDLEKNINNRINNVIDKNLQKYLMEAAREFVNSSPIKKKEISNREIAAANGISLRAAKRLRRSIPDARRALEAGVGASRSRMKATASGREEEFGDRSQAFSEADFLTPEDIEAAIAEELRGRKQ